MSLISGQFLIFVCVALLVYYLVPKKQRWIVLLVASYAYYLIICNKYIVYMLVTTMTTYLGARGMDALLAHGKGILAQHKTEWSREDKKLFKKKNLAKRRAVMLVVLLLNFGILGFLKYFDFAFTSIASLFGWTPGALEFSFVLPLGISFYTFQSMGYLIDVYGEKFPAEKNPAKFALFVSYFPQIIQGPIAFYDQLAVQLYEGHELRWNNIKNGLLLILWGVFKKVLIADRAVKAIDFIIANQQDLTGTYYAFAAILYALQLYADFSGGIDIVRGVGQMFGITMAENFKRPYFSRSLTEYWHRWHMTLGNWVRNYVFYPLSISKQFLTAGKWLKQKGWKHLGKVLPTAIASLITFLIIGIWHGANSKYIAFGLWNGLVILIAELIRPGTIKIGDALHINRESWWFKGITIVWTFILVLVGYYFDIAHSFKNAMFMMWNSIVDFHARELVHLELIKDCGLVRKDYLVLILGTLVVFVCSLIQERSNKQMRDILARRSIVLRWAVIFIGIFMILIFGYYGPGVDPAEFVYMQF